MRQQLCCHKEVLCDNIAYGCKGTAELTEWQSAQFMWNLDSWYDHLPPVKFGVPFITPPQPFSELSVMHECDIRG